MRGLADNEAAYDTNNAKSDEGDASSLSTDNVEAQAEADEKVQRRGGRRKRPRGNDDDATTTTEDTTPKAPKRKGKDTGESSAKKTKPVPKKGDYIAHALTRRGTTAQSLSNIASELAARSVMRGPRTPGFVLHVVMNKCYTRGLDNAQSISNILAVISRLLSPESAVYIRQDQDE